jgi:hypothetical protein
MNFMSCDRICSNRNTTNNTSEAGTTYPSWAPAKFTAYFSGVLVAHLCPLNYGFLLYTTTFSHYILCPLNYGFLLYTTTFSHCILCPLKYGFLLYTTKFTAYFSGVLVAQTLVFYVAFCRVLLACSFVFTTTFSHCILCPLKYGFLLYTTTLVSSNLSYYELARNNPAMSRSLETWFKGQRIVAKQKG